MPAPLRGSCHVLSPEEPPEDADPLSIDRQPLTIRGRHGEESTVGVTSAGGEVLSGVISTPHDALVRAIFGTPEHAAAEPRAALSPALLAELRLETLALLAPEDVILSVFAAALPRDSRSSVMTSAMTGADQLRLQGRRESLLELLAVKFGTVDPKTRARVEAAPLDQVVAWMRRFVVADSVEKVFAD